MKKQIVVVLVIMISIIMIGLTYPTLMSRTIERESTASVDSFIPDHDKDNRISKKCAEDEDCDIGREIDVQDSIDVCGSNDNYCNVDCDNIDDCTDNFQCDQQCIEQ
ncbi:MAG: hypothetical protein QGH39_12600 [Candidatus Thermoplasmatota archaeon]|nr:hypothetical protein [Candidatus Thermoplasmatota archaeon]MDP7266386.1 hypothetical protein [Candidatus Thermoplasmatota archaeon]